MTRHRIAILLVAGVLACGGAAEKPAADPPACMHCGATCGLEPICVCEPGTRKRPRTTFETTCDPICVPGCGSRLWPRRGAPGCAGCTSCTGCTDRGPGPCTCPGRVKQRKKLKKETTDEEVPAVVHKVAYVCAGCAGGIGGCVGAAPAAGRASWWHGLTRWWPWTTRGGD